MSLEDFQPIRKLLLEWAEENQSRYTDGYFERGEGSGYINYSWKPDLITPHIRGIINKSCIKSGARLLDFGCAKGFYVKVLQHMGYDSIGIDISEYALSQSPKDIRERLFLLKELPLELFGSNHFELTIAKDVLEHIPDFALDYILCQLKRISKKLFVIVPVCNDDRSYMNDGDERDLTHEIRYSSKEWMEHLGNCILENELCRAIKRDKSKGSLCCFVSCDELSKEYI